MIHKLAAFSLAFLALAALAHPALAAVADAAATVNLTPLFTELFNDYAQPVITAIAAALIGWLAALASKRLGLSISASMRQQVVDFAAVQAKALMAKVVNSRDFNIDVKNPLIAAAAREAEAHVGDALKAIGITGPAVTNYVSHLIVAHLGDMTKGDPDQPTPAGAIAGTNVTPDGATIPLTPAPAA